MLANVVLPGAERAHPYRMRKDHSMRRRTTRATATAILGAGAILPIALPHAAQAADGDPLTVNIFHLNDSHSHLDPGSGSVDLGTSGGEFDYELGGWPRVDAMFKQLEAAHSGENNIKIHAGDAITGSLYYTLFAGEADAAMMNLTCFDLFEVGNHEFDSGDEALVTFLDFLNDPDGDGDDANDACNTDVLGANVVPAPGTPLNPDEDETVTDDDYLTPYVVREFTDSMGDPQQVGFIGLDIAQKTKVSSSPLETTEFLDEVETAQEYVDLLTADGVENIVIVSHYGFENDQALAAQVTGVDAIIGGDSHTLLGDFEAFGMDSEGDYPTVVTNADGDPVCVAQAWQYSSVVGELELTFQDGKLTADGCAGTPHLLVGGFSRTVDEEVDGETVSTTTPIEGPELTEIENAIAAIPTVTSIEPSPDAVEALAVYSEQVAELAAQVIGTATEPLCLNRLPGDNRSAGICTPNQTAASGARAHVNGGFMQQIVTDAFLARAFRADIALQNAGGVRVAFPAGEFSVADAYENLPFANTLVEADLTGQEIVDTLESAVANFLDEGGSDGSYPYGSAVRWDVDISQPAGSRFSNVEVRDRETGEWSPIDLEATYVVVTNSFLMNGGDGYTEFKNARDEGRFVDTGLDYAQSFIDWVVEDQNGEVSVPAPEDFSTQSFVGAPALLEPVTPTRVLDTREDNGTGQVGVTADGIAAGEGVVAPGTPVTVPIAGRAGIPPYATAVSLNLAVTDTAGDGYLTAWPTGTDQPLASSINYGPGTSVANSILVPIGEDGTISLAAGVNATHVIADVTGWSANDPAFLPLTPSRLLDTRSDDRADIGITIDGQARGQGLLEPGNTLELQVSGRGAEGAIVPAGATAAVINLTGTEATGPGYLTVWDCGGDKPLASTFNFTDAGTLANSVVVPLSADGKLCIESGVSSTHVVADVTGAYLTTDQFGAVEPARLLDTRDADPANDIGLTVDGQFAGDGALTVGEQYSFTVAGRGDVPEGARLVALNVTVTGTTGPGYLTAWDCTEERPLASSLNFATADTTIANSVIVPLSADGELCLYSGVSGTEVVADVTAYYL